MFLFNHYTISALNPHVNMYTLLFLWSLSDHYYQMGLNLFQKNSSLQGTSISILMKIVHKHNCDNEGFKWNQRINTENLPLQCGCHFSQHDGFVQFGYFCCSRSQQSSLGPIQNPSMKMLYVLKIYWISWNLVYLKVTYHLCLVFTVTFYYEPIGRWFLN